MNFNKRNNNSIELEMKLSTLIYFTLACVYIKGASKLLKRFLDFKPEPGFRYF